MKYFYYTNCVSITDPLSWLFNMMEDAREISYRTFTKYIPYQLIREMFPQYKRGFHIKDDWSVVFYKSKYHGKPCYYLVHSAIEYIFLKEVPHDPRNKERRNRSKTSCQY